MSAQHTNTAGLINDMEWIISMITSSETILAIKYNVRVRHVLICNMYGERSCVRFMLACQSWSHSTLLNILNWVYISIISTVKHTDCVTMKILNIRWGRFVYHLYTRNQVRLLLLIIPTFKYSHHSINKRIFFLIHCLNNLR